MRLFHKLTAIILIVVFSFTLLPINMGFVHAQEYTKYEEGITNIIVGNNVRAPLIYNVSSPSSNGSDTAWTALKDSNTLPVFVTSPTISVTLPNGTTKTFGFNFKLWNDKKIVVYGQPSDVGLNPRIPEVNGMKDWKTTADDAACGTYYSRQKSDGTYERGEYRYHGYDYAGNKYSNTSFPVDSPQDSINSYKWLYKSWDYPYSRGLASIWNKYVLEKYDTPLRREQVPTEAATKVAAWITKGLYKNEDDPNTKTRVEATTMLDFKNAEAPSDLGDVTNPNYSAITAYNYANIMSAPTLTYPGESKLWIKKNDTYRYRTSFVKEIANKIPIVPTLTLEKTKGRLDNLYYDKNISKKSQKEQDDYQKYLNSTVAIELTIVSTLADSLYYNDPVLSTAYYTRRDMLGDTNSWHLKLSDITNVSHLLPADTTKLAPVKNYNGSDKNAHGKTSFKLTYKVSDLIDAYFKDGKTKVTFSGVAISRFHSRLDASGNETPFEVSSSAVPLEIPLTFTDVPYVDNGTQTTEGSTEPVPVPQYLTPDIYMPEPAFDIVAYKPIDNTDFTGSDGEPVIIVNKEVIVDGTPVDYDTFFSGTYVFGETGYDRLSNIVVRYTAEDGNVSQTSRWIRVLNTKPRVQFSFAGNYKQNRAMTASNTSSSANTPEVLAVYPINSYSWSVEAVGTDPGDGTNADIRTGTATDMLREFTFKKPGTYKLTLTGRNTLGRVSDPYILQFEILQDIKPAVICELDNISIARGETISAYAFESVSTDGDAIAGTNVSLYYDSDNNGTPETLVNTWTNVKNGEFPKFTADKLGMYRWVITSKEKMLGNIISAHVTDADATVITKERDFWVDNYIPQTSVYLDTAAIRAVDDVFIMTDAKLAQEKIDFVKTNRMNFNNYLRLYNILPVVEQWDMKTYTYSQPAETSSNTGTTVPPETLVYTSGGYSGTLNRTSYVDNGSYQDFGSYQTKEETKTFTAESGENVVTSWYLTNPWENIGSEGSNPAPETWPIDKDGYSGSIPRTGFVTVVEQYLVKSELYSTKPDRYKQEYSATYKATYAGDLTKTVSYWVSDWRWVSNYTGYYSGTIYKDVRQPFTDPFRATSDKYVIYVSDGNVAQLNDLLMVLNKSGAKLILIGDDTIKSQVSYDYFILNDKPISDLIYAALNHIGSLTPEAEKKYVLAGIDSFNINIDDYDQDGDQIVERKFQYVQNQNYFDNPTGIEPGVNTEYSDSTGWVDTALTKFNNVGEYTTYRRIKDLPTTDTNFENYSYYSNLPTIKIYAHRKPIANATLDWDFDPVKNVYITRWVDKSYDQDHEFNRPDKGIVERKIMFRKDGGEWQYTIPSELGSGTYNLEYFVKDVEGVWSDPFKMDFTLTVNPPIQIEASARTFSNSFSMSSIPASEYLEAYNVWTRYPYNLHLELAIYQGTSRVTPVKTVNYSTSTGTKTGNDISWNNISYQIPETLADGSYTFRISAIDDSGRTMYKDFPVTVKTPINLVPNMPTIYAGITNAIKAATKKYPNTTTVQLYKGTPYATTLNMAGTANEKGKDWTVNYKLPSGIPDGIYTAEFTSRTPNGNVEVKTASYQVLNVPAIIKSDLKMAYHRYSGNTPIPVVQRLAIPDKPDYYSVAEPSKLHGFISAGRVLAVRVVAKGNITGVKFDFNHSNVTYGGTTWDYGRSIKRLDRDTRWFEWYSEMARDPEEPSPFCRLNRNTAFTNMFAQYGLSTSVSADPPYTTVDTLGDLDSNHNRYYNASAWPLDAAKNTYQFTKQEMSQRENNGITYTNSFGSTYTNLDVRTAKDDPTGETKIVTFYYPLPYLTNQTLKTWHWIYKNDNPYWFDVVSKDNDDDILTRISSPYKLTVRLYNGTAYSQTDAYFDVLEPWINIDKGYGDRIENMLLVRNAGDIDISDWECYAEG